MTRSPSEIQRRLDALAAYQLSANVPENTTSGAARLASEICETPIGLLTILDDRVQFVKESVGINGSQIPIEDSFCAHAIKNPDEVMVVSDTWSDARFRNNPLVTGKPRARFYAGAPLVTPEGVPIGALCVLDRCPRRFSKRTRLMLKSLAESAIGELTARRLRRELRAERERADALSLREAYFRHLTEYSLDLITILAPDGTILFESRSIQRELGHDPAHYRGRNAFEFVHPFDRERVAEAFGQALARNGNTPVIQFRFLHADGSYRTLEGSGNNLLEDVAVQGIVFNSRDITERLRLEEEVERSRTEKEHTIARLTGGVAHDFNNILTAIQGFTELTEMALPAESPELGYLAGIRTSIRRAAMLTQQLLAVSRRVVMQPQSLELTTWLSSLRPRLERELGEGVEVSITTKGELRVWQDAAQFEQVILQIASNACDAMQGRGRLSISAFPISSLPGGSFHERREGCLNYVQLDVSDHGCGIAEETLSRIFEPFFTTKTLGNHSGLGLAMCRGIIEQSGGHLAVESKIGMGAVFHIYLPTSDAMEDSPPPIQGPKRSASHATRVLFVDDEPMLREIGEMILLDAGYAVSVAEDGPSALACLAEIGGAPLDLLITDVIMPGMTGVQLAAEVTRLHPETRVLLCSGYTRDALAQSGGLPAGISFMPKPYTLTCLLDKVTEVLGASVEGARASA